MEQLSTDFDRGFAILEEIKEFIRPLSQAEYSTLEQSIKENGVMDDLKVAMIPLKYCKYCYNENAEFQMDEAQADGFIAVCKNCDHGSYQELYLIDGHNRLAIAEANGIGYEYDIIEFESMDHVKLWITQNQLGRRNLTEMEVHYYRGKKNNLEKIVGQWRGNRYTGSLAGTTMVPARTSEAIANEYGVGQTTIKRDAKLAQGIDKLTPDLKAKVLSEEVKPLKKDLQEIAKAEPAFVAQTEEEIVQKAKEIRERKYAEKKLKRKEYIQDQVRQIELGELPELKHKYNVLSVDPPWPYGREYDPNGSRVANPYPEMSIEQIKAIELPHMDDAIIWLWTTHKFLPDAFDIMAYWGYEYKATMVWDKESIGMGYWLRMQCEFCLLGIKGNPFWDNTTQRDIIREARREHSRKPDSFFEMVNAICPGRKLEYFARESRLGWDVFGNETSKF